MRRVLLVVGLGIAWRSSAGQTAGMVQGVARDTAANAPIAFAIVRLRAADQPNAEPTVALTDSIGRFAIHGVPAGDYRLQLDRIGFERIISPVLHVRGETLTHDILTAPTPLRLSSVKVVAPGSCLDGQHLSEDSELNGLWTEAVKGIEARHELELHYRYTTILHQSIKIDRRFRRDVSRQRVDTFVNEPDSVAARLRRIRETHRSGGYVMTGNGRFLVSVPEETELLDDQFLEDHCLVAPPQRSDSGYVLRFRTMRPPGKGYGLRGVIHLDTTFLIAGLEFDYVIGDSAYMKMSVAYTDTPLAGVMVRMRGRGEVAGRAAELPSVNWISSIFENTYSNVARVRP